MIAIGLNRIALGLGLISAFSIGLALVLCCFGLLLARARGLVDRFGLRRQHMQRFLPLGSAVVVSLLGAGIVANALFAYMANGLPN